MGFTLSTASFSLKRSWKPTDFSTPNDHFSFSYYADSFILDTPTQSCPAPKWKQILTRGFPTYRAQAKLHFDPVTGFIYLYGGYTNSEILPGRKNLATRYHSDLWRLRLDIPGGGFEKVNWEDESRTARAGPWQRCFSCGSTGRWKKCGGESPLDNVLPNGFDPQLWIYR